MNSRDRNELVLNGWVQPEEAEGLQLFIRRLQLKIEDLERQSKCPECGLHLPPQRCEHCHGDYSIDA